VRQWQPLNTLVSALVALVVIAFLAWVLFYIVKHFPA
jgi:hypothetical protein